MVNSRPPCPPPEHRQAWPQLGTILRGRPATSTAKLVGLVLFGELEAPMPTPDHCQAWPQLGTILRDTTHHYLPESAGKFGWLVAPRSGLHSSRSCSYQSTPWSGALTTFGNEGSSRDHPPGSACTLACSAACSTACSTLPVQARKAARPASRGRSAMTNVEPAQPSGQHCARPCSGACPEAYSAPGPGTGSEAGKAVHRLARLFRIWRPFFSSRTAGPVEPERSAAAATLAARGS